MTGSQSQSVSLPASPLGPLWTFPSLCCSPVRKTVLKGLVHQKACFNSGLHAVVLGESCSAEPGLSHVQPVCQPSSVSAAPGSSRGIGSHYSSAGSHGAQDRRTEGWAPLELRSEGLLGFVAPDLPAAMTWHFSLQSRCPGPSLSGRRRWWRFSLTRRPTTPVRPRSPWGWGQEAAFPGSPMGLGVDPPS